MRIYSIAGLNVELNCHEKTMRNAEKYLCHSEVSNIIPDISITTDVNAVKKKADEIGVSYDGMAYIFDCNEFARKLLNFDGVWIHASAVVVDGYAYLFSANSGVGKSTHTSKWLELFGERAFIINDDKPIVRFVNGEFLVYGSPWSGKNDVNVNTTAKLKGLCFIQRDKINKIERLDKTQSLIKIAKSSTFKVNAAQLTKKMQIFDKIIMNVPIYEMGCTPTIEAARMAYEFMSKLGE